LDHWVHQVHLALLGHQVKSAQKGQQDREDPQVQLDRQGPLEKLDRPARSVKQVQQDPGVHQALLDLQESQVHREALGPQVQEVQLVRGAKPESQVLQAPMAPRDLEVTAV